MKGCIIDVVKLLYVEDDINLAYTVKDKFSMWFDIDLAFNAKSAWELFQVNNYDVVLIDYGLPDKNGIQVCRKIRDRDRKVIILFISSEANYQIKVEALKAAADDYILKPINFAELTARIQANMRRCFESYENGKIYCDGYIVDQDLQQVFFRKKKIEFNRKEYKMVERLMLQKGKVMTRSQIYEQVWNKNFCGSNTIDVHIRRIRNKTEAVFGVPLIRTAYGSGYYIVDSQ